MINVICQVCKNAFQIKPSRIKYGWGKFCSRICLYKNKKGFHCSEITKKKISKKAKKRWTNPEFKKKSIIAMNLGRKNPEYRKRMRKIWDSFEWKETMKKRFKEENHPNWKGGIYKHKGYILILKKNHPYANTYGYICEHRFVIEQQIGRYLKPKEVTHHLNKIKSDNRPENLMAFKNHSTHRKFECNIFFKVKPEEIIFDGRNHV